MDIYSTILAAIVALSPSTPLEDAHRTAVAIDDVAANLDEAIALTVIAHHESHFRAGIADCSGCTGLRCDAGRAVSAYQLHSNWLSGWSREEVCADPALATWLAARAWRQTGSFAAYAGCQHLGCRAAGEVRALGGAVTFSGYTVERVTGGPSTQVTRRGWSLPGRGRNLTRRFQR